MLGFVESFRAHYYCRNCECTNQECQLLEEELPTKLRQKHDYESLIPLQNGKEDLDYQTSKGIKKYCVFNDLENYSIFENCTVDIMHDCNEGIIPFFVQHLFDFITENHILRLCDIQRKVRDFNYGSIWKKYRPSLISTTKSKLGQNAMQNYCLFIHLPFILIDSIGQLTDIWYAMTRLLQALQIIYSATIH